MSELTTYQPRTELTAPSAAHALVEWAQSADAAYHLAQKIISTSFCPQQFRNKPAEAAAAMLAGAEVGLSPMTALRAFDVIQGVAAPRAITLRAVAQAHGCEFITVSETDAEVIMRARRRGSQEWETVTWDMKRAQGLGLTGKDNWRKQPRAMLVARATAELARRVASDAILGIGYASEEVADVAPYEAPAPVEPPKRTVTRQRKEPAPAPEPEEPPLEEPEPPEPVDKPAITKQQLTKLHILLKEAGLEDRDTALKVLSDIAGRDVDTSKALTREEASRAIDALSDNPDPEPVEWEQEAER